MDIIQVKNLSKSYKYGIKVLDKFNLDVKEGEIFSLLGENGAGKSTLIKILTSFLAKDSGKVKILDYDLDRQAMEIRKNIACVSQQVSIDTHFTLEENMLFQARLYHIPRKKAEERMDKLINSFSLNSYKDYPVDSFSGGIKRRLDIAMNMMSNPKILFLDEPSVGMDIRSRNSMWETIETVNKEYGTTIFLTSHYLEEADKLSDRILIMKDGKDIICDSPKNLKSFFKSKLIEIVFSDLTDAKEAFVKIKKIFAESNLKENTIKVNGDFYLANKFLLEENINFLEIKQLSPSLEDIFLDFTENKEEI